MRVFRTSGRSAASVRAAASNSTRSEKPVDVSLPAASRRDALLLLGASTALVEMPTMNASASEPPPPTTASTASPPPAPASVVARAPAAPLTPRERDAVAAYELSAPSVVNVFDLFLVRGGGVAFGSGAAEPEGNGSGVLWRDPSSGELVVVTNFHVLASSLDRMREGTGGVRSPGPTVARVVAQTTEGKRRALDAAVVGVDRAHDLAVLVLLGGAAAASSATGSDDFFSKLRPIERSETASTLRVGQQVFALGNPFGFELTFTGGLVSGINRSFESKVSLVPSAAEKSGKSGGAAAGPATISGAIQHSAPINPGSSGGPLLDSRGKLVGLSTAIYTDTGSSVGLGFALPVDLLERIVPQLVSRGRATTLGAGVALATPAVSAALLPARGGGGSTDSSSGSSLPPGVMISSVVPGSGADRAGLLPVRRTLGGVAAGDLIVSVGGRATPDAGAFAAALEAISSSGSSESSVRIEFEVVRGVGSGQQRREKVGVELAAE